ncbi:MAG: tetratricopeptide repeat protein, partial [Gemmataceae bacterium]|nr:tetratricopeptide repeat protein [Gemmataceae bacterium]
DPRHALAHNNLGNALRDKQDLAGAIAAYRKAIQLDPRHALAHNNLGIALYARQDLAGAIAAYQKAIQLDPRNALAHCNLGLILRDRGHFADALASLQRGHDLGMKQPHWRYPSAQWVEHCQRLLVLDRLLPAVLKGGREPKDAAEQLALADLCLRYRKCPAAAARFYTAAFQADAGRADDLRRGDRYNAACAAALAAAGEGEDARKLADKERTRLRRQALDWLRAHLAAFTGLLEKGTAKDQAFVEGNLRHWQKDADLASVRDADHLARLSEAERQRWQTLWADVAALLDRVRRTGKQP